LLTRGGASEGIPRKRSSRLRNLRLVFQTVKICLAAGGGLTCFQTDPRAVSLWGRVDLRQAVIPVRGGGRDRTAVTS
jgi:hypothetical protein